MCGIAGYIGETEIAKYNIKNILESMSIRGPDHQGYFHIKIKNKNIYLFHSRLSIIDLKKNSNQPFRIGNKILVFNGEIYNYLELKEKLKIKKHKFQTNSDTEVLLRMYIEYGNDCFDMLEGMWSFAIWDGDKDQLILSRDRFGEKPLYYYSTGNEFCFGSETKFLKNIMQRKLNIDFDKCNTTLSLGYRSIFKIDQKSYYKDVFFLEPHHNLFVNCNLRITKQAYWKPKYKLNKYISYEEAKAKVRELLIKSVELRLRSDVKIAFALSGGVDSSILAAISSKILNYPVESFSIIDQDPKYNELSNIILNSKYNNIKNNFIKISSKNFLKNMQNIIKKHQYPYSTITAYVQYYLMKKISSKGYKVCILGSGADEIFTGYYYHYQYMFKNNPNFKKDQNYIFWKKYVYPFIRNPIFRNFKNFNKNIFSYKMNYYNEELQNSLILNYNNIPKDVHYCSDFLRNKMMLEAFQETLPVSISHDDTNAMAHSVENRSPYLDRNLYEFVNTLPTSFLSKNGFLKYILRDSFKDIVPNKVLFSREKKGFNFELSNLINFKSKKIFNNFFNSESILNKFVNKNKIYAIIKKYKNIDLNKFLFNLINIKLFYEVNK